MDLFGGLIKLIKHKIEPTWMEGGGNTRDALTLQATVQKNIVTIGEISGVYWGIKERWF